MQKFLIAALVISAFLGSPVRASEPTIKVSELPVLKQERQHKVASKRVTAIFTRSHYHRFNLDDKFSEKIFMRYLKRLDYNRSILLQSDVDRFSRAYKHKFDDMMKNGDLDAIYEMHNFAEKRRYERFAYALKLLDKKIYFGVKNDKYVFDRTEAPWAKTQSELDYIWQKRVKYDALNLKLTGKSWDETVDILTKRYNNTIKRISQTNSEDVFQGAMNAFARSVDPHTSYLSPRSAERFKIEMNLSLEGIGAVLQLEDDYTMIKSLVVGGPADLSKKLAVGDKIIGVGQQGESIVDVIGWRLDDVVDLIKGPKGSRVTLQVIPKKGGSSAKPNNIVIMRNKIRLEDRAATSEVIEVRDNRNKSRKIGVLSVPGFYMNLTNDAIKEIGKLKNQDIEGLVIDLRGNGGGALTEATLLSGLFIDEGPIVQTRTAAGIINHNDDTDGRIYYDGPLTVLIDRNSASASEIFAAALQDYNRALIVGDSTFGKGTVQQHKNLGRIYDLYEKSLGYVQYTMAKFYRINGGSTQIKGVTPDIQFPSALKAGEYGEAEEDNALPWDKIKKAKYTPLKRFTQSDINVLKTKHQQRIRHNVEFDYILKDIEDFKLHHDDKTISLVESERIAERDKEDAKQLARLNERRIKNNLKPLKSLDEEDDVSEKEKEIAMPDAFINEAAAITLDLVELED